LRLLSKYHQACVYRQSHHLLSLTRSPELVCRRERFIERQLLLLFNFHTLKIILEILRSLWGVHPTNSGAAPGHYILTDRGVAVGNSFVKVGIVGSGSRIGAIVEEGELLVEVCAVDRATACWVAAGTTAVSPCWLHPHSDKPASALAVVIWILLGNLILAIPSFKPALADEPHRLFILRNGKAAP